LSDLLSKEWMVYVGYAYDKSSPKIIWL